ncbi:MAG TPA: plastocyanin, partial [Dehalococcoidia bacterium]|nr:plastocyanin [Dehalococcoidia bacterium]
MRATITVLAASAAPAPPPPSGPGPVPPPSSGSVSLGDNFFSPGSLSVAAGATVTWTNNGGKPHTVTSSTALFDSGTLSSGQRFSYTFQG